MEYGDYKKVHELRRMGLKDTGVPLDKIAKWKNTDFRHLDRVYQAKLKGIIEPCYETIAEPNSYGFRPMRSTKDAIEH